MTTRELSFAASITSVVKLLGGRHLELAPARTTATALPTFDPNVERARGIHEARLRLQTSVEPRTNCDSARALQAIEGGREAWLTAHPYVAGAGRDLEVLWMPNAISFEDERGSRSMGGSDYARDLVARTDAGLPGVDVEARQLGARHAGAMKAALSSTATTLAGALSHPSPDPHATAAELLTWPRTC